MENIYKIKIKTNPNTRGLYPSERRYSASIVLGISVVHICLAGTAILMAVLAVHTKPSPDFEQNVNDMNQSEFNETVRFENSTSIEQTYIMSILMITIASYICAFGALLSGVIGFLAWKCWYIDANIKWMFFASVLSTITSLIAFIISMITIWSVFTSVSWYPIDEVKKIPNLRHTLAWNVLITCILEFIWSILSTRISYKGMKNNYPDDIVLPSYGGKITVNTVHLGNKKAKATPPDILNHFEPPDKFSKFFPKPRNDDLPKEESNKEYQERVQKFLRSETNADVSPS